jgi:hypothetical protein
MTFVAVVVVTGVFVFVVIMVIIVFFFVTVIVMFFVMVVIIVLFGMIMIVMLLVMIVVIMFCMFVFVIIMAVIIMIVVMIFMLAKDSVFAEIKKFNTVDCQKFQLDRIASQSVHWAFEPRRQVFANPKHNVSLFQRPRFGRAHGVAVRRGTNRHDQVRCANAFHNHGDKGMNWGNVGGDFGGVCVCGASCQNRRQSQETFHGSSYVIL